MQPRPNPATMAAEDVRRIRAGLGLTQAELGHAFGAGESSVRRWEAIGIDGPAAVLLALLEEKPHLLRAVLRIARRRAGAQGVAIDKVSAAAELLAEMRPALQRALRARAERKP